MNRRKFLNRLLQVGLVATATSAAAYVPKFDEYPEITYNRDWVTHKATYLHTLHARQGEDIWYVAQYGDGEFLEYDTLKQMFSEMKTTLDKGK